MKHIDTSLLYENPLDKMMGAPGLAFETWDPPRKCRGIRVLTHIRSSGFNTWGFLEVRVLQFGLPAFAWRIPGLKSETWGTHRLIQEVLTQSLPGWAEGPAGLDRTIR